MTPTKLVVVVLVLFVVLSVIGIGGGFFSGGTSNDGSTVGWTETIRDTLAKPRPLSRNELQPQTPNCPTPIIQTVGTQHIATLRVQGSCNYTVPKSSDLLGSMRSLPITLTVTPGTSADITLHPSGSVTVKHHQPARDPDDAKPLDIYKDGGRLEIVCSPFGRTCFFGIDIKD
jgi:hypothetical protein